MSIKRNRYVGKDDQRRVPEDEQLRNCLTIRFSDADHRLVTETAWRNRTSASGWIREIALDHLEADKKLETTTP